MLTRIVRAVNPPNQMAELGTPPVQTEPTPPPTAGEPTPPVTPVEPAPVSTTPPAEELPGSAREVDGGVAGYLEEKAKALAGKGETTTPPVETATPPVTPPVETPPVVPPVETPPATPPVEPVTPPPVTPPVEPPVEPVTPPATPPVEPEAPDRIRLKGLPDGHLVAAANEIARAEGITFEAAFARVTTKATTPPAAPPSETRTRADVERDLETARGERRSAAASADALEAGAAGKMTAAQDRIEALQTELGQVETAERRAANERQQAEETAFGRDVQKSKAKAVQYWPEAADETGDFSKRMIELSEQYEKDPDLAHHAYEANAPFFFAELVAKERGLSPAHLRPHAAPSATPPATPPQPATPPPTKPAPVSQRAVVSPVQPAAGPASGAARTSQEVPKIDYGIEKIGSVADYEKVKKAVLRRPGNVRVS